MRIESVRIQNLRSVKDETVRLGDYTGLVGPNGSGKSNVLCALNIFFRQTTDCATNLTSLDAEDFHHRNTNEPIRITVTFTGISAEAQADFANYVRHDKLTVSALATFDPQTGRAEVRQYGERLVMPDFAEFFKAEGDGATLEQLRPIYQSIKGKFGLPSETTKTKMIANLRSYEEQHLELCRPVMSEDQFYGVSRGKNRLQEYVQWVYVPAVKDVTEEQTEAGSTALKQLLARTVRTKTSFGAQVRELKDKWQAEYGEVISKSQNSLAELSESLARRLADWYHPAAAVRLEWGLDPSKSVNVAEPLAEAVVREGSFEGELPRFGHGLQRAYLLALLQELSGSDQAAGPTLILGCEEPELYQHPPQARHLLNVLQQLSEHNSQLVVCTHSPYFVSGKGFEDVRMVRMEGGRSVVSQATYDEVSASLGAAQAEPPAKPSGILAKLHQALQPALNEMFFTPKLILVEGLEDVAYVAVYLSLMGLWDEYRRYACHVVPTDGKGAMIQPIAVANCLHIPTYVVFDADGDKPDKNGSRKKHEKDNAAILRLRGIDDPAPFPPDTLWADGVTMWHSDMPAVVKREIDADAWESYSSTADQEYGQIGSLQKNGLHIARCLELAWKDNRRSESLQNLCAAIVAFGKSA
jgi:energy-coupling factor transporter ATP-binding protein EcfA2